MILSKSYKDAMDRIKMSPELKERIISASEKGEKKRKFNFAYIGASAAGLAACIALIFTLNVNRAEKTAEQPVEVAESIVTVAPESAATESAPEETEYAEQTSRVEMAKIEAAPRQVPDIKEQVGGASAKSTTKAPSGGTTAGSDVKASVDGASAKSTAKATAGISSASTEVNAPVGGASAKTEPVNAEPKAAEPEVSEPEPPAEDTRVMMGSAPETAAKDTRVMMGSAPEAAAEDTAAAEDNNDRIAVASAAAAPSAASAPIPRSGGGGGAAPRPTEKPTEKAEATETTGEEE